MIFLKSYASFFPTIIEENLTISLDNVANLVVVVFFGDSSNKESIRLVYPQSNKTFGIQL